MQRQSRSRSSKRDCPVESDSHTTDHYRAWAVSFAFCTAFTNSRAAAMVGMGALPRRMSPKETSWLYQDFVALWSCCSSAPFSDAPMNAPLLLEYVRIPALYPASAEAERPTGPAAAETSAPSFT